jgi:cytochrome c oxidase assembly protein subunit 15
MKDKFLYFSKASLILIYLVIFAGAIVRMTGSGMGCPDWPKCFGYLIPPTKIEQLQWKPLEKYNKGQIIISQKKLLSAKNYFISKSTFDKKKWEIYSKHNYAKFDVYQTWIEYINRLLGALSGLVVLLMTFFSFSFWNSKKIIPFLSLAILMGMFFQAWLGKTVVDSNLLPFKITLHLAMAILLVILIVVIIQINSKQTNKHNLSKKFKFILILGLIFTILQIAMGTQIRQFIDELMKPNMLKIDSNWIEKAPLTLYIHRSFSLLILLIHVYLGYVLYKKKQIPLVFKVIILTIILEIFTGILMYYFTFPFSTQPLHLLFATILIGAQSFFLIEINKN